jgi:aminoacrylate hydrolase
MALAKSKIAVGDAELGYIEAGTGAPLVLVPGLGGDAVFWSELLPSLSEHFHVFAVDHRGCGASPRARMPMTFDGIVADIVGFLDAIGEHRILYVGHSAGGAIGQAIAVRHPERLRALVLSSTWAGPDPYIRRTFDARLELLHAAGFKAYRRAVGNALYPPWWISRNASLLDAADRQPAHVDDQWILEQRIAAFRSFDGRTGLAAIRCPTLVIGAADDMVTPIHFQEELAAGISGAQFVRLPTGGHTAPRVATSAYATHVVPFLRAAAHR